MVTRTSRRLMLLLAVSLTCVSLFAAATMAQSQAAQPAPPTAQSGMGDMMTMQRPRSFSASFSASRIWSGGRFR